MACQRAERLAAAIVIRIVLLSALMGYTVAAMDEPQRGREETSGPRGPLTQGIVFTGICGILPATAGTAGAGNCGQDRTVSPLAGNLPQGTGPDRYREQDQREVIDPLPSR